MFFRHHTRIALLAVALHLLDLVVAAGHHHAHLPGDSCAAACHTHHAEHSHGHTHKHSHGGHAHAHSHSHCHSHAPCDSESCPPQEHHPASAPHHDCAICQHLALTPALVSPASPLLAPTGSSPVVGEVDSLLPPLRTVECRSRAPPILCV